MLFKKLIIRYLDFKIIFNIKNSKSLLKELIETKTTRISGCFSNSDASFVNNLLFLFPIGFSKDKYPIYLSDLNSSYLLTQGYFL